MAQAKPLCRLRITGAVFIGRGRTASQPPCEQLPTRESIPREVRTPVPRVQPDALLHRAKVWIRVDRCPSAGVYLEVQVG